LRSSQKFETRIAAYSEAGFFGFPSLIISIWQLRAENADFIDDSG